MSIRFKLYGAEPAPAHLSLLGSLILTTRLTLSTDRVSRLALSCHYISTLSGLGWEEVLPYSRHPLCLLSRPGSVSLGQLIYDAALILPDTPIVSFKMLLEFSVML